MACGCSKNKNRVANAIRSGGAVRNVSSQARAGQSAINPAAVAAEQKKIQAIRQDAIRRALNK